MLLEERELKKENDIIKAQALPTSKPKKPANKPNEFKTNDDFCPGCGLELRSMTKDRVALFRDVFVVNLETDSFVPGQEPKPGLLRFRGWGLEQRLGDDRRMLIESLRKDIEAAQKKLENGYAYVHGVRDVEKPVDLQVHLRGNPLRLGDSRAPRFPLGAEPGDRVTFSKGSGRLELARTIATHPLAMRVIVNRVWKGHFGTGIVDTPSNFGLNGERPTHPELLDHLANVFVANGMSIKALHREIMRSAVYQLSGDTQAAAFAKDAGNRLYWHALAATAERRTDSRCGAAGLRRARHAPRRAVGAADAARRSPDHLRPRQPLQDGRVPAALRLPEPEPVGRAALLHQRAAAASVLHEQRLHPAACRARRRTRRRGTGRWREDREGVSAAVWPRADGG